MWTFRENVVLQVFSCILLKSCALKINLPSYPILTSSGEKSCLLSEEFKRRECLPACPLSRKYCHGRCVFSGLRCLFHPCSIFPYRDGDNEKSCTEIVENLVSDDGDGCKIRCNNLASDSGSVRCQTCLLEKLPDACKQMSGASCWHCTTLVMEKDLSCSQEYGSDPDVIRCIKRRLPQRCKQCSCTILCYLFPDSDICRKCLEEQEFAALFVNHKHCAQGWVWSESSSKCFRAVSTKKSKSQASSSCENLKSILAESKTNQIISAVNEAINQRAAAGEYWVGGVKRGNRYVWPSDNSVVRGDSWGPGFPAAGKP